MAMEPNLIKLTIYLWTKTRKVDSVSSPKAMAIGSLAPHTRRRRRYRGLTIDLLARVLYAELNVNPWVMVRCGHMLYYTALKLTCLLEPPLPASAPVSAANSLRRTTTRIEFPKPPPAIDILPKKKKGVSSPGTTRRKPTLIRNLGGAGGPKG